MDLVVAGDKEGNERVVAESGNEYCDCVDGDDGTEGGRGMEGDSETSSETDGRCARGGTSLAWLVLLRWNHEGRLGLGLSKCIDLLRLIAIKFEAYFASRGESASSKTRARRGKKCIVTASSVVTAVPGTMDWPKVVVVSQPLH